MPKERKQPRANRLLPPERAALREPGLATGRLAEDGRAALADDDGLGVGENGGDGEAAGALDVHEEGAGRRHKGLQAVSIIDPGTDGVVVVVVVAVVVVVSGHTLSLCLRASAAGLGLRRSTARTFKNYPSASRPVFCLSRPILPADAPISVSPQIAPYHAVVRVAARAPIFGSKFDFLPARVSIAIVVGLGERWGIGQAGWRKTGRGSASYHLD